jgi:hypothetical protein
MTTINSFPKIPMTDFAGIAPDRGRVVVEIGHADDRSTPTRDQKTRKAAIAIRELWMTQLGMDRDEIQRDLADENINLEEELEQLAALREIQKRNAEKDLSRT